MEVVNTLNYTKKKKTHSEIQNITDRVVNNNKQDLL